MIKSKIALVPFLLIFLACRNNNPSKNFNKFSSNDSASDMVALETIINFSKIFEPDSSSYEGIGTVKNIPDSIVSAFKILRATDTLAHKKYLMVVFLKLHLDHLRCCHQSYELREPFTGYVDSVSNPMLYEFNLATKMFDLNKYHEFISSAIAKKYIENHKELLEYPEIKQVINEMRPIEDSINKHLYWNN
jgi:hypothetical protein